VSAKLCEDLRNSLGRIREDVRDPMTTLGAWLKDGLPLDDLLDGLLRQMVVDLVNAFGEIDNLEAMLMQHARLGVQITDAERSGSEAGVAP